MENIDSNADCNVTTKEKYKKVITKVFERNEEVLNKLHTTFDGNIDQVIDPIATMLTNQEEYQKRNEKV